MILLLRKCAAEFDARVEFLKWAAKDDKAKYDAYVDAGFTPEQSLALVIGGKR